MLDNLHSHGMAMHCSGRVVKGNSGCQSSILFQRFGWPEPMIITIVSAWALVPMDHAAVFLEETCRGRNTGLVALMHLERGASAVLGHEQ